MMRFIAALSLALFAVGAACGAARANDITTENAQTSGVTPRSVWDLTAQGSSSIEGFTTEISVNRGATVNFKIKTASNNWRIDIYRLGYYQGNGARRMTQIIRSTASPQPAPIVDATTGLVDAGNWSTTVSWTVPGTAVSGVYIAHLVDQNNPDNENHIPFIVRNDASTSDIVFQTSDTTWQAYNGWGGANLYGGNGPGGDSSPGRAYKVSYNRPICTRDGVSCGVAAAAHDFIFGAEYSAISWLEQNGYDVSYIAGADVARSPAMLLQHKIFLSVGHDEYWDTQARANVEAARTAGVHLAFMSGNEVYWKTRWEPSIAGTLTEHRTLVCYKETRHHAPLDPLDASPTWTWTGTWRDPRNSPPADGGKPENRLTGTLFTVDSYRDDAIQVPYEMSRMRFWRNAPLASSAPGATTTLTKNILGYEWDSSPDNWFRPGGTIDLSSTTLSVNNRLLDFGTRVGDGEETHNLTMYKDPANGSIVFGAGTVFWVWGLSAEHDGASTPTDQNIQQATVNLLADMGAQPETLQTPLVAALASTDSTPPVTVISNPVAGASFEEGAPVAINGTASDVGGRVAGVEVSIDDGVTWHKANGLNSWSFGWTATPGTHVIRARATDDSLNTETPTSSVSVSAVAGGVTMFGGVNVPERQVVDDFSEVELGLRFTPAESGVIKGVKFMKSLINIGPHSVRLWNASGGLLAQANVVNETPSGWQTALFPAPVAVNAGATYTASYHTKGFYSATTQYFSAPATVGSLATGIGAGVYRYGAPAFPDSVHNNENYWVDVLYATSPPTAPPVITSPIAASGSIGVSFAYQIVATNSPTQFAASPLPAGLTINPATGLISGTPTASGATTVTLSATNAIGTGTATLTLTVTAAASTYSLFSLSDTPAVVTEADPDPVELGVKFTAASPGAITGMRFYKGPQNIGAHTASLWSASGDLLASASFSNESASGWQTVQFAAPVTIAANTTYVASYHTNGFYSANSGFFVAPHINGPLTAPASDVSLGNGVYLYGAGSSFPTNTHNATNYWVDVVFAPSPATQAPVIQPPLSASGAVGAPFAYQISATNSPTSFSAAPLPAGLSINSATGAISGTPTTSGAFNVTLTATNAIGSGTATLALNIAPAAAPPVISSALTASGVVGSQFAYTIQATNNPTSFSAAPLPNGLSVDTTTGAITGTPTTAGAFTVTIGATNAIGTGTATLTLTLSADASTVSLFSLSDTPATVTVADPDPVELGVKLTSSGAGVISGMRFYKGPQNTGAHVANLWSASGTLLASAIFSDESASGWQTVQFAAPVTIAANTTYIASYHSNGFYSANGNFFAAAHINGPLTAPASDASGGNGVYMYGAGSAFPTNTFNASNYWVDVLFAPSAATQAPVIEPPLSAAGIVGAPFAYQINATNNPTSYDAAPLPAGLSINSATGAISGTPTTSGAFNVTLTATNAVGAGTATLALNIAPAAAPPVITSALAANGVVGAPLTYQISATNNPTSFSAAPLPPGLSVNPATGTISGTPTTSGPFSVTLTATNAAGSGTATLSLNIAPAAVAPVITSPLSATGAISTPFSYAIQATNSPTSFGASPLPLGLTINAGTGIISGTPRATGTSTITLRATNAAGSGTAPLILTVLPRYTLSVSRNNSRGVITSSPAGITCGSDCSQIYVSGTSVTLTATPNAGRSFDGWTGACSGTSPTCVVLMNANRSARAFFR